MSTVETPVKVAAPAADTVAPPAPTAVADVVEVVFKAAWRTHIGHKRDNNEDSVLFDPDRQLFAVADGLGGRPAGELASALTIQSLKATGATPGGVQAATAGLVDAIGRANAAVLLEGEADEGHTGMGSTVVACHVTAEGRVIIIHSGDSRAYLRRDGRLARLTLDHVRVRSNRRLLSRCVGRARGADPDVTQLVTEPGDRLLLCTDGLTDMVGDDVIGWLLREPDPDAAADALVEAALSAGGGDNVTVVVVDRFLPDDDKDPEE